MSVWVSSRNASPSICWKGKTVGKKLHIHLVIAAGPQCRYYLSFKCSSMFFTSRQSFDKTGHLVGKEREVIKCLCWTTKLIWASSSENLCSWFLNDQYVCVSWLRTVWLSSMSDLLGAPSGHSLGSQPQDLREQLAVFVPAEGHPVWGRHRDARREHRLMQSLLEGDGFWRGWGQKSSLSSSEIMIYMFSSGFI